MAESFGELIERYGVPRLVIPNTPRCDYFDRRSGSRFVSGVLRRRPFDSDVGYYRAPYGDEPYLLVGGWVEVPARHVGAVRGRLEALRVVELRRATRRGPRGGVVPVAQVVVADCVVGIGRDALDRAAAERRVLAVTSERSMGDGYVHMNVVAPGSPVGEHGYTLLFDAPCDLGDEELPHAEAFFADSARDLLEFYELRYIRALPLTSEVAAAARRPRRRAPGATSEP